MIRLAGLVAVAAMSVSMAASALGSTSMYTAGDGWLLRGVEMAATGRYHRLLHSTTSRGYVYGTDELVNTLHHVARTVARRHRGAKMVIGNLSKKGGGDIIPSVSHNSGRDVDIAFYMVRADGSVVRPTRYYTFDSKGRAGALRFDVVRNWALVRALLLDKTIQVQYIFVYEPLAKMLLDYAKLKGEPAWLLRRAQKLVVQPLNSSPHDDHFHVRLFCTRDDRLEGCLNTGPVYGWIDDFSDDVDRLALRLARDFDHVETHVAVTAIRRVAKIRGEAAIESLASALTDSRAEVRRAATDALAVIDGAGPAVPELVRQASGSRDPDWLHHVMKALAGIRDAAAAPTLMAALEPSANTRPETWAVAAQGLGALLHVPAVPSLIRAVGHPRKMVREAAADALFRITNHDFGAKVSSQRRWAAWWKENRTRSRDEWVKAGFARRGIRLTASNRKKTLTRLVALIRKGGPVAFNARALIAQATGFHVERRHFNDLQLFRFYQTWLKKGGGQRLGGG